jgi:hypothetical protein
MKVHHTHPMILSDPRKQSPCNHHHPAIMPLRSSFDSQPMQPDHQQATLWTRTRQRQAGCCALDGSSHGVPCPVRPFCILGQPASATNRPRGHQGQMNELTVVTHITVRREGWWSEPFRQVMGESQALRLTDCLRWDASPLPVRLAVLPPQEMVDLPTCPRISRRTLSGPSSARVVHTAHTAHQAWWGKQLPLVWCGSFPDPPALLLRSTTSMSEKASVEQAKIYCACS